ncbi:MAG: hypothetical protein ABI821_12045 [Pseudomonadota bacterium]
MTTCIDHLWQSLLICGGIAACALLTRASRAVFRLWLWRVAALKFLFPFALLYSLGEWLGFPVAYTADSAPPSLVAVVAGLAPLFAPARMFESRATWAWLVVALTASTLCIRWTIGRIGIERRRVRNEQERRQHDVNDVLRFPGLWATAFMTSCALLIFTAPLLSGGLADRQRRHELLIVNSLSLRKGQVVMTVAAPGMGERYRVVADENGVLIRNANLIDIVAIVYAIHRSVVWTEQRASGNPVARRDFWMSWPRYDVRVTAPVREPEDFDAYALRQPVTKLLAERFGLEVNLDNQCQPPCGNYGVAMPEAPL